MVYKEELEEKDIDSLDVIEGETSLIPYDTIGHYLAEIRKYPFLSKEDEFRLAVDYKEKKDMDALIKLILSNLRVVVSIAFEYKDTHLNLSDLIQEGNIGLMQSLKKFDPYRGVRLYTYASWWIRAYILRYIINNWRLVKIGTTESQRKLFYNLMKEKQRLEAQGLESSPKLLAEKLQVKEKDVIEMSERLGNWELSLDQPVYEGSEETLLGHIIPGGINVEEILEEKELKNLFVEKLKEFSKTLNKRDLEILQRRILSTNPETLDDIGKRNRISKERVRQIEKKIVQRIKEFMKKEIKDFDIIKDGRP
ncbi:MAG: RNA polymerase factor sigma-32 [Nitrospirota bacterium]